MCSRYTLYTPIDKIATECRTATVEPSAKEYVEKYNLSPTDSGLVIFNDYRNGGIRTLGVKTWGLVPWWSKDAKPGYSTFNARVEGVLTSGMYKDPVRKKRAVIPVSGYYEWIKGQGKVKYPMFIHRRDGAPLYIAGLWESKRIKNDAGEDAELTTYTMMTTEPNGYLEPVHNRMVALLESQDEIDAWLDTEGVAAEEAIQIIAPDNRFPNFHDVAVTPVSRAVNNTKAPDDPAYVIPLAGEELNEVIAKCQTWNEQSGQNLATLYRWSA